MVTFPCDRRPQEILEERRLEQRRRCDFQGWLTEVRQKRNKILDARNARRQKKANMAKRGTLASQQRMRLISQLAARQFYIFFCFLGGGSALLHWKGSVYDTVFNSSATWAATLCLQGYRCWLCLCFHNPLNSDVDYGIFNVRTWSFVCVRIYTHGGSPVQRSNH